MNLKFQRIAFEMKMLPQHWNAIQRWLRHLTSNKLVEIQIQWLHSLGGPQKEESPRIILIIQQFLIGSDLLRLIIAFGLCLSVVRYPISWWFVAKCCCRIPISSSIVSRSIHFFFYWWHSVCDKLITSVGFVYCCCCCCCLIPIHVHVVAVKEVWSVETVVKSFSIEMAIFRFDFGIFIAFYPVNGCGCVSSSCWQSLLLW